MRRPAVDRAEGAEGHDDDEACDRPADRVGDTPCRDIGHGLGDVVTDQEWTDDVWLPPPGEERVVPVVDPRCVEVMRELLAEAAAAGDSGEVPVAAAVLDDTGAVVGRGANRRGLDADPTAHAEIIALREAGRARGGWRLDGCALVVTLEPCPMCAGAAIQARVARIVFGAWDDKAGACGSVWDLPRDRASLHRPAVVGGVLEEESAALLRDFFEERRRRRS